MMKIEFHSSELTAILQRLTLIEEVQSQLLDGVGSLQTGLSLARFEIDKLLAQGRQILMSNAELHTVLDEINAFTNTLAEQQAAQGAKLTEIGTDLDDLIAQTNDPTVKARLEAHRDAVSAAAALATSTSDSLTQLAAKHDAPVPPPPVE